MTTAAMVHRQLPFAVRFEWGLDGARAISSGADLAVVVDVLSFTTCVSVAVDRGATVFPYPWMDASAEDFAAHHDALLAGPRGGGGLSLSPSSLRDAPALSRVVLPSPNGSALAHELAQEVPLIAAVSLRNAAATADWVASELPPDAIVAVIAAGERWPGGPLRPAVEDQIGAGAFIAGLAAAGRGGFTPEDGREGFSPEAEAAMAVFNAAEPRLRDALQGCSSGRELIGAGYVNDVEIAAELDAGFAVALLRDGAFGRP
ncbi:2-phosphosulfolactate phosphatase [Arthrobacter sp. MMS18-M83]|uniref:2-phosphosulfolactate phosphatase n=1 Tax=Arthrobacter sp. MMS18-M83 TaxID=2996261 RepID=UPI00227B52FF|nr:2-phosphosulfolactate phosphatase [Arthrobacter sp. MMS18-M83]WAH95569.1 2-phosphosulfolactate phosphatase [Arthrobacter sp. MMS18-M83]